MNIFHSLGGMIATELTSVDAGSILAAVNTSGIHIHTVERVDELTLRLSLRKCDYPQFSKIVLSKGCTLSEPRKSGLYWVVRNFLRRPVLIAGLMIIILLILSLPGRVFFIRVEGNEEIPGRMIVAAAEECGIRFGASRKSIRSEKVKNALLAKIPQLQWAGVNTKGCVAVISVREKTYTVKSEGACGVSSIIADRDGIIVSCTATQGNLLCRTGQAVSAGQVLISGYTDCGLSIKACRSVGEVYAQTLRHFKAITPQKYALQSRISGVEKRFSLIVGKKRINFYKDSGILGATCDKMSVKKVLALPGGFILPITVVTEYWTYYENDSVDCQQDAASQVLQSFSRSYLMQHMVAGKILSENQQFMTDTGVYGIQGNYACLEMIGREQQEETLVEYGKSD